jgi:hypothetical protein
MNWTGLPIDWQFRFETPINMVSTANYVLGQRSGMILVNDEVSAQTAIFICGGGTTKLVEQTDNVFGTTTGDLQLRFSTGSAAYYLANFGTTTRIVRMAAISVRPSP